MGSWAKKLILNLDDLIASLTLALIVFITSLGVIMRYVVGNPLTWNEEIVLALFVWFTFIGASSVTKRDGHVSIDYIYDKLPVKAQNVLNIIRYGVLTVTTVVVFVFLGYQLSAQAWIKITPVLRVHYTFIDMAIPLGGLLASIHLTRQVMTKWRQRKDHPTEKE